MWSRKSMWIHVVQFRKRGRGNLSSRTTLQPDSSLLDSRPSLISSVEFGNPYYCFSLNFWNLFILYHFYVVLRGNLGVFVSWRFSCTCKQLLQGAVCAQNMMLFITHLLHQHHLHHHLHLHKQSHHNRHCRQSEDSILRTF